MNTRPPRTCATTVTAANSSLLKVSRPNALARSFHVRPRLGAGRSLGEDFLHWRPIGVGPATAMALVTMSGHTDLGKVEPGATTNCAELKNRNRVVIGRPVECPPGLNNFLPRP